MSLTSQARAAGLDPSRLTYQGKPLDIADASAHDEAYWAVADAQLRIVVYGTPLGKPRMTQRDKWAKRPAVLQYRDWADRLRAAVGDKLPPAQKVLSLSWTAYFVPPESWPKKKRLAAIGQLHRSKPDLDNLLKCLDALYTDDSGIAKITAVKLWDRTARIEIVIEAAAERQEEKP